MATRRYGQYCAIAKALDVLGDRWSLLIVRELGPLPGFQGRIGPPSPLGHAGEPLLAGGIDEDDPVAERIPRLRGLA